MCVNDVENRIFMSFLQSKSDMNFISGDIFGYGMSFCDAVMEKIEDLLVLVSFSLKFIS